MKNPFYAFGQAIACAELGVSPDFVLQKSAQLRARSDDPDFHKAVAKVASLILAYEGGAADPAAHLMHEISKKASLEESDHDMIAHFTETVGNVESELFHAKRASFIDPAVQLGLAGGAGVGTLAWLLNRNSSESEGDILADEAKRDYYYRIAKETRSKLKRKYPALYPAKPQGEPVAPVQ